MNHTVESVLHWARQLFLIGPYTPRLSPVPKRSRLRLARTQRSCFSGRVQAKGATGQASISWTVDLKLPFPHRDTEAAEAEESTQGCRQRSPNPLFSSDLWALCASVAKSHRAAYWIALYEILISHGPTGTGQPLESHTKSAMRRVAEPPTTESGAYAWYTG